jgi:hypothetical protein
MEVIHTYTRKQALADGFQIEVTQTAKEAGIKYRTFATRTVWDKLVVVPPGVSGQDEQGRLWDIVWMTRAAIVSNPGARAVVTVKLYVRNDERDLPELQTLLAMVGPTDIDDPAPAITIMDRSDN